MKIYVDKIPEEGIEISGDIEPGQLLVDTADMSFIAPIGIKLKACKTGNELLAEIWLEVIVEYTCGKCLSRFKGTLKKKFSMSRKVSPAEIVEIDDDVRQEIILDYPIKILCRPDCKGLCPNCGQNLNAAECECDR